MASSARRDAARHHDREPVALVCDALDAAPPGNAGWTLPVDPLLRVQSAKEIWALALAKLRTRAL